MHPLTPVTRKKRVYMARVATAEGTPQGDAVRSASLRRSVSPARIARSVHQTGFSAPLRAAGHPGCMRLLFSLTVTAVSALAALALTLALASTARAESFTAVIAQPASAPWPSTVDPVLL